MAEYRQEDYNFEVDTDNAVVTVSRKLPLPPVGSEIEKFHFGFDEKTKTLTVKPKECHAIPSATEMREKFENNVCSTPITTYKIVKDTSKTSHAYNELKRAFASDLAQFYIDTYNYILKMFNSMANHFASKQFVEKKVPITNQNQYLQNLYTKGYQLDFTDFGKKLYALDRCKELRFWHYNKGEGDCFCAGPFGEKDDTVFTEIQIDPFREFGFEPVYPRLMREFREKGYIVDLMTDVLKSFNYLSFTLPEKDPFPTAYEVFALAKKAKSEYDPTAPKPRQDAPYVDVVRPKNEPIPEKFKTLEGIKKAFEDDLELFYQDTKKYLLEAIQCDIEDTKTYGHLRKMIHNHEQVSDGDYSKGYNFENKMLMAVDDGKEHVLYHKQTNGWHKVVNTLNPYKEFGLTPVYVRLSKELSDKGYCVIIKEEEYNGTQDCSYHNRKYYWLKVEYFNYC